MTGPINEDRTAGKETRMTTKKPSTESQPQPNPQKSGAGGGTVILGQSWYHHIKKVRAAQAAKKD